MFFNNTNCISCFPYKYLYYGNCINNCSNGYYTDIQDNLSKICKYSNTSCLSCPLENPDLCYSCNDDYFPKYNDTSNIYKYEFRKKCYSKCPENTKQNNYYCDIECPEDLPYEILKIQECVKNFNDITKKICILNNKKGKNNENYKMNY